MTPGGRITSRESAREEYEPHRCGCPDAPSRMKKAPEKYLAVGDDDQNIYAFTGASVEFIRRFEDDYKAQPTYLIENYRSTVNIIRASNHVIASAAKRMKGGHDITVNRARRDDRPGSTLERLDSVGRGRVQVLRDAGDQLTQAVLAVEELERLSKIVPDWDWAKAAVIAREWSYLQPVRSYCEARGIPVQTANADLPNFWRLRETQTLVNWLRTRDRSGLHISELTKWMDAQPDGTWWSILREGVDDFVREIGDRETDRKDILEWLAEWGRDARKRQNGLLLLSAHRAKGLEFDDVVVLEGNVQSIDYWRKLLKPFGRNLNRGDSREGRGVIHPVQEDGPCQHLCRQHFGRGFGSTLKRD